MPGAQVCVGFVWLSLIGEGLCFFFFFFEAADISDENDDADTSPACPVKVHTIEIIFWLSATDLHHWRELQGAGRKLGEDECSTAPLRKSS